jgi:hypothetical protein
MGTLHLLIPLPFSSHELATSTLPPCVHDRRDRGRGSDMENPEMPRQAEQRPSDLDARRLSADDEVPEADRIEQATPADEVPLDLGPSLLSVDDEVPEADRIEQTIPVEVEEVRLREPAGDHPEVDEADWLDQRTLEVDDDDR